MEIIFFLKIGELLIRKEFFMLGFVTLRVGIGVREGGRVVIFSGIRM